MRTPSSNAIVRDYGTLTTMAAEPEHIIDADDNSGPGKKSAQQDASEVSSTEEQTFAYEDSRKLGVTSSVFLILNKMIGTGIFSTPSGIFAATGNVGVSIILWIVGGIITFTGLSVYLEFGLVGFPREFLIEVDRPV
jgi:amino acid permease